MPAHASSSGSRTRHTQQASASTSKSPGRALQSQSSSSGKAPTGSASAAASKTPAQRPAAASSSQSSVPSNNAQTAQRQIKSQQSQSQPGKTTAAPGRAAVTRTAPQTPATTLGAKTTASSSKTQTAPTASTAQRPSQAQPSKPAQNIQKPAAVKQNTTAASSATKALTALAHSRTARRTLVSLATAAAEAITHDPDRWVAHKEYIIREIHARSREEHILPDIQCSYEWGPQGVHFIPTARGTADDPDPEGSQWGYPDGVYLVCGHMYCWECWDVCMAEMGNQKCAVCSQALTYRNCRDGGHYREPTGLPSGMNNFGVMSFKRTPMTTEEDKKLAWRPDCPFCVEE